MGAAMPKLFALALLAIATAPAFAGSATATLQITILPALNTSITPANPSVVCNAPPGTLVGVLSTTGGNGNPATYNLSGGDMADFAIASANLVVGPNGIAAANCPAAGQ